ncbi:hypothetical protein Aab01nite_57110 [Paractinoplanes abujensis]|uniref:Papain fold toxin 1 (Glutamine deamidase) of polymorphic toxin system n=1 Tax=Paractinoplanes abujensis TaxID=882441 RepID=A0A7W7G508_9ACTN|nr:toxin glutamine deamidase domain-containing protein [Actinoplanes abujensis]MBB4696129.1 hypothetical protein [Actinoplanes abujensis]GID22121.1 hypothetical protein Aab01nite_57110 [Actinoplanes abujensis]
MSVLPSPVPHPLEFSPFDVPAWAYEALEWVVGFDWPAGNEVATWDVADRWFSLASTLAAPNEAAMAAANRFLAGYGGEGVTAEGFEDAWQMVAGDENAPLHDLLRVSGELGRLVEGCGADIEAAKLEAWIEIGIFLVELVGMAITVTLTLGAASPAAGGLIVATRLAIQQIFKRLVEQLGKKALKQTAGRTIKQLSTREGLRKLGHGALREGFDEAREEVATNGGIQLYQQSTGRSDGFDLDDLGRSALAGFAGGAGASAAHVGSHGHGGIVRGAGGEVLAEFSAAATFGQLPDAEGLAKSATSGVAGSAVHGMHSPIDIGHLDVAQLDARPASFAADFNPGSRTPSSAELTSGVTLDGSAGPTPTPPASSVTASPPQPDAQPTLPLHTAPQSPDALSSSLPPSETSPSTPSPAQPSPPPPFTPSPAEPSAPPSPAPSPLPSPSPSTPSPSPASPSLPSPSLPDNSNVLASTTTLGFADPSTAPPTVAPPAATPAAASPAPGPFITPTGPHFNRAPGSPRAPFSDLDRIADALGPRAAIPRPRTPRPIDASLPRTLPTTAASSPAPQPEIRDEQAYFGYVEHARQTHERNRREEYATYLDSIAEDNRIKILDLGRRADEADRSGVSLRAREHRRQAFELSEIVAELDDQISRVRSGELAPDRVEVDPPDWARINRDVGNLAPGGVRTGDGSALDGFAGRPPIDRTRHYNVTGGLRPPLAVHQVDLENAVPRDADGRTSRLPDPRSGTWFRLANDGGPAADPTRGLNCVDGVLSLFDTYIHGRPRVAAPRTFDVYANGNPDRPLGGETNGINRIRQATGGDFQGLCPYVADADPALAKPAIDLAVQNLTNHLLNTGHGAFAFLITDLEGGGSHSWAALNQNGTVLYVDPQIGRISEQVPLYRHHGVPTPINVVSLEALVVDANAVPTPLPNHAPGNWSTTPPTGTTDDADRQAIQALTVDQRQVLDISLAEAEAKAVEASADLRRAILQGQGFSTDDRPRLVDEHHRVKQRASLARKVLGRIRSEGRTIHDALNLINDRVRFSVQVSSNRYGESVSSVLRGLQSKGYDVTDMENYWSDRGRHNGLNVTLTAPDGFVLEVQFPTQSSLDVGHDTHVHYEDVRRAELAPEVRVEAFLQILKINKEEGIYSELPRGLDLLNEFGNGPRQVDTSLAGWLGRKRLVLEAYRRYLVSNGTSFEDVLRRHGLTPEDVPGAAELGLFGD